ncbi:hypothetical protein [Metallosphaera javensis (ex Sakai et al. 2022)]|uniref:hypothetical protein n=1 Tax=Metallosphaera javensis (ex Sakai et al. 2022) TaxID=2775498 RepID=UPI00258B5889|nr:MAG: hypothetical protein MjAS7_0145 [Metallosphaera javensis (ex Sakai et al. 2022)]
MGPGTTLYADVLSLSASNYYNPVSVQLVNGWQATGGWDYLFQFNYPYAPEIPTNPEAL